MNSPNSISIGIGILDTVATDELPTEGAVDNGTVDTDTAGVAVMTLSEMLDVTENMSTVTRWGQQLRVTQLRRCMSSGRVVIQEGRGKLIEDELNSLQSMYD